MPVLIPEGGLPQQLIDVLPSFRKSHKGGNRKQETNLRWSKIWLILVNISKFHSFSYEYYFFPHSDTWNGNTLHYYL
jgi:hypothetical protein